MSTLAGFLLAATVFMLPFDQMWFFEKQLREMSHAGPFYPMLLVILFLLVAGFKGHRFSTPKGMPAKILMAFAAWCFLSALINLPELRIASFKGRSGLGRLFSQSIMLGFGIFSAWALYNLVRFVKDPFHFVKQGLLISMVIAGALGLIEIIVFYTGSRWAYNMMFELRYALFYDFNPLRLRLRTICQEPSSFAMWMGFVFPWVFGAVFRREHYRWALGASVYLALMMVLTFSRLAYIDILIQIALTGFLLLSVPNRGTALKRFGLSVVLFLCVGVFTVNTPMVNLPLLYNTWVERGQVREIPKNKGDKLQRRKVIPVAPVPVAPAPITSAPVTSAPATSVPVAPAPITSAPVNPAPDTSAPVAPAPVTPAPVTSAPATSVPVAPAPITSAPVNPAPDTSALVAPASVASTSIALPVVQKKVVPVAVAKPLKKPVPVIPVVVPPKPEPEERKDRASVLPVIKIMFLSFRNEGNYYLSNASRLGSVVAAFRIGVKNPVFGVGLGQYGFHMAKYVPTWALINLSNPEFFEWMRPDPGTEWPPIHNLYARLAAEMGFPGMILWLAFWIVLFRDVYVCWRRRNASADQLDLIGLSLLVVISGVLLVGLSFDSFRYFGYWITAALSWIYIEKNEFEESINIH